MVQLSFKGLQVKYCDVCVFRSAKVCEEKLRYAAYNCVAIDTDMSPWEEWQNRTIFLHQ